MPVIEYARTRIFRQGRQARTPAPEVGAVRPPARVGTEPEVRSGPLAHPRLVPRPRTTPPPAPLPRLTLRPGSHDRDFEEEPTDEMAAVRSLDMTRPRDVTAARSRSRR